LVAHRHGENANRGIIVGNKIKLTRCSVRAPQIGKFQTELDGGRLGNYGVTGLSGVGRVER
jgi:hypothetical protein